MTVGASPAHCSPSFGETHELILRLDSAILAPTLPEGGGTMGFRRRSPE